MKNSNAPQALGGRPEKRHAAQLMRRLGRLAARARVTAHVHAVPALATLLIQGLVL